MDGIDEAICRDRIYIWSCMDLGAAHPAHVDAAWQAQVRMMMLSATCVHAYMLHQQVVIPAR
jgi:hypothetical protein